jgi:hypothetical protein
MDGYTDHGPCTRSMRARGYRRAFGGPVVLVRHADERSGSVERGNSRGEEAQQEEEARTR